MSSAHGVVLSLKEVFQLPQFESTEQVSARQKLATWRRYWAKALDIALFVELVTLAKALLIRAEPPASPLPSTAWFYGSIAVFLVYEATALHRFGTTLGKFALGLKVTKRDGNFLSFGQAVTREMLYFVFGDALLIPLVSTIANFIALQKLKKTRTTNWDEKVGSVVHSNAMSVESFVILAALVAAELVLGYEILVLILRSYPSIDAIFSSLSAVSSN